MAQGDFRPAYNSPMGRDEIVYRPNGKSTTIYNGEPVVITTNATFTTASNPVARTLAAADIAALYAQSSAAGIFGFSLADAITNSAGIANTQAVYAGKSAQAEPILQAPSYGSGIPPDPNILYSELKICVAIPGQFFRGKLLTGTASNVSLGLAGIDLTTGVFTVNPSATTKILSVVGFEYNTSYVIFEVLPGYCQILTANWYSSQ